MIKFLTKDREIQQAIEELMKELPQAKKLDGEYSLIQKGTGLQIRKEGKKGTIYYEDRRSLMRAVGLAVEYGRKERLELNEAPVYHTLGTMPDAARNAVPKLETLKKLCRILALEGYNALLLYMEDNYEIPGQPYFGRARGRYTDKELQELDAYAEFWGSN